MSEPEGAAVAPEETGEQALPLQADSITVRVGRLPGPVQEIDLNGGRTVADALAAAGVSKHDASVRVDGTLAEMDQELTSGQTVHVLRSIRGN